MLFTNVYKCSITASLSNSWTDHGKWLWITMTFHFDSFCVELEKTCHNLHADIVWLTDIPAPKIQLSSHSLPDHRCTRASLSRPWSLDQFPVAAPVCPHVNLPTCRPSRPPARLTVGLITWLWFIQALIPCLCYRIAHLQPVVALCCCFPTGSRSSLWPRDKKC